MKLKVGDAVTCQIETRANGGKYVLSKDPEKEDSKLEEQDFLIIRKFFPFDGATHPTYSILIPDDFVGWTVSEFYITHHGVGACFKDKKFWDVTEDFIIKKV